MVPVESLTKWLFDSGMARAEVVEVPGEFSVRGGILDVFPADASDPVRIEFFGDEVESIRPFDVETQRSLDRWTSVTVTAAIGFEDADPAGFGHPVEFFPEGTWVALLLEPTDLREEGRRYLARLEDQRGHFTVDRSFERLIRFPTIAVSTLAADSLETTCHMRIESIERFSGELTKVKAELDSAAAGENVLIACHNAGEVDRLGEVFSPTPSWRARTGSSSRSAGSGPVST